MLNSKHFAGLFLSALLAACAASPAGKPAPIENKTANKSRVPAKPSVASRANKAAPNAEPDWRPKTHIVNRGETLYSLALEYGLDYKELASWNELDDANIIRVGQTLRLTPPASGGVAKPVASSESGVVVKPLAKGTLQVQPIESSVSQPKALAVPYSETALNDLKKAMSAPPSHSEVVTVAPLPATTLPKPAAKPGLKPNQTASAADAGRADNTGGKLDSSGDVEDESIEWVWPTQGKLLSRYNEKGNKGIDIAGKKGQEIFSASVGKVVYSGSGLRGYGKLVIIKHNKTYLSAYAHNQAIFVKEGDSVAKGQKIAEMGDSDSDVVKLHFEIRRFGKPVDPSKYLPAESAP